MAETVSVCVPAYQAEKFLDETLDSVLAQTWPDLDIVIAVDAGRDDTPRVAMRYASHERVRVVVHDTRLGWIKNTNFVLGQGRSRFAMIMPHDDILAPDYVARCMAALGEQPGAVIAYCDVGIMGNPKTCVIEDSVLGPLEDRLVQVLRRNLTAPAFRGVLDRRAAPNHAIPGAIGGFAADSLWVARLACQGGLVRVPARLYEKRFLPTSAHAAWKRATPAEHHEMWAVHCTEMLTTINRALPDMVWSGRMHRAWQARVRAGVQYTREANPLYSDASKPLLVHVRDIYERVRVRPVPYSWCE